MIKIGLIAFFNGASGHHDFNRKKEVLLLESLHHVAWACWIISHIFAHGIELFI